MRIGLAGLGTVGAGLVGLLQRAPSGSPLAGVEIVAVSARSRTRKREVDISSYAWVDDPVALAGRADVDVLVELIGGSDGPAKSAVTTALERGAHVVTANKALLAEHGAELAALSERTGGQILFEAAVGGGMPVVKAVRESLAGAQVQALAGILNGTCNYLLTEMESSGRSFEDVLQDAQRLGYAEADPTTDVGGYDAAHKLAVLAGIAFGTGPDYASVAIEGVERVTLLDLRLAGKLGYRVKLVARAERAADGAVRAQVGPMLLPFDHPLARVDGALNALVIDSDPVGRLTFIGRGAGAGPTATAVAADLVDLLHGARRPVFGRLSAAFVAPKANAQPDQPQSCYLRLLVEDRPGVIAAVSNELARAGVSILAFLQDPSQAMAHVPIVLTTQPCARSALDEAVARIASLPAIAAAPQVIPIAGDASGRPRHWS